MRTTIYLKVGKGRSGKALVNATKRRTPGAILADGKQPVPTVTFKLNLTIPDEAFGPDFEASVEVTPEDLEREPIEVEVERPE